MAKVKGPKIPKEVAGVKIPKGVRKAGKAAAELAQQPVVGEFVAAALTAAAASLMAQTKTGKAVRRQAADWASETVEEAPAIGAAVKRALLDAARELLDSLEDPEPGEPLAGSGAKAKGKRKKKA
ncbi:MAG TPA: hypothetical protein VGR19_05040 [Allosphingosinicella sp.]|nr:hypothetical protein [Allosphingosinicella sp.]